MNHATGVTAIQGCRRAAQHFNALGGIEVEGCSLALAVGGAGRYAVGNQLDAAHPKRRAGTKATGRYLQVLGIVLTVLHHQPRYTGQHLGCIDAQLAILDLLLIDTVHRVRQVKTRAGAARAGDDTGIQLQGFGADDRCQAQAWQ